MHMDYGWGMGYGWLFMVVFWVVIILVAIFLIKLILGGPKDDKKGEAALDILKKRYAKGEISKEEFEEKKKDLI